MVDTAKRLMQTMMRVRRGVPIKVNSLVPQAMTKQKSIEIKTMIQKLTHKVDGIQEQMHHCQVLHGQKNLQSIRGY